ncbi:hypothetical protein [Caulobacter sp. 17J65-9]|uniref:hypothetical protein n=1 Tax=Caulobacter sp. 17J65-9 TaxID=2709382 RepID=UPI0013C5B7F1|nr:hypothetical protein [Caulobacter sp. 17J65-9]NEX94047.1 hypothetical protein [Caulobacter sp. 17J65-9]
MSARRLAAVCAAVLALAAGSASATPTPQPAPELSLDEQLQQIFEHLKADRCEAALPLMRQVFTRREFLQKPVAAQGVTYEMAGLCEMREGRIEAADELLAKADKVAGLHDFGLQARVLTGLYGGHVDQAVAALERLQAPDALKAFKLELFQDLKQTLAAREKADLRQRMLAALDRLDFAPDEPFETFDAAWAEYARMIVDQNPAGAARAAARISDPGPLLELRLDKRFAALVDAEPARFDLRAAAERKLAADRAAMAANPKLLAGPHTVASDLRVLGRADEALAVLDAALARTEPNAWTDAGDQLRWARNERAYALLALGRFDEAVAALRQGADLDEHGTLNVSQVINLAEVQLQVGRPEAALETLAVFEAPERRASAYGVMWVKSGQACAYAALGRKAELRMTLTWLAAHADDNPAAHTRALLCAGDVDGAAASYKRRLADPEQRADALAALSQFDPPPVTAPGVKAAAERLAQVRARPDVQAAIAKAGRVERVPLVSVYWGDI